MSHPNYFDGYVNILRYRDDHYKLRLNIYYEAIFVQTHEHTSRYQGSHTMLHKNKCRSLIQNGILPILRMSLHECITWGYYKELAMIKNIKNRDKLIEHIHFKIMDIERWSHENDGEDMFYERIGDLRKCILVLDRKMVYSRKYSTKNNAKFYVIKN